MYFLKSQIPWQKNPTYIGQSISDQLQICYKVMWIVAEGSWVADKSWRSTSAKQMMFWGDAMHNVKQKESGGNELLVCVLFFSSTLTFLLQLYGKHFCGTW